MTNEQIEAMATWTLEDFQNDPLAAIEQIRELAAAHLALQQERDAAVWDLESLMGSVNSAEACCLCERDGKRCHSNFGAASCRPKWRGPYPEQVLAPADQSAGAYADNPVLAQAWGVA